MDSEEYELLSLPPPEEMDRETIIWEEDLPASLLEVFKRFTRIPNSDNVTRLIAAYELMPLVGLEVCSGLFCFGSSGSGKSSLTNLLQRLNPCRDGSINPLTALDSPAGWLQSFDNYRLTSGLSLKPSPFIAIDDLIPKSLSGEVGSMRLQILKQLPNRKGCVTKGSVDGDPIRYYVFSKFAISSITDLPNCEGLSELGRRLIPIRFAPIEYWEEEDLKQVPNDVIPEPENFEGWNHYQSLKIKWLRSVGNEIVSDRTKVKRYFREHRAEIEFKESLYAYFAPVIAMGLTAKLWDIEEGLKILSDTQKKDYKGGSHLKTLLDQWIRLDSGYGKLWKRWERYRVGFEIDYLKITKFCREKVAHNQLSRSEITRNEILEALSSLGFEILTEDTNITIRIGQEESDE